MTQANDMTSKKDVYVVEVRCDLERALDKVRAASNDNAFIYIPSRARQTELSNMIPEGSSIELISYETNNPHIDNDLFGFAQAISNEIARLYMPAHLRWSFFVALQDSIVGRIRPAMHLANVLSRYDAGDIIWVPPSEAAHFTPLWETLISTIPGIRALNDVVPMKSSIGTTYDLIRGSGFNVFDEQQVIKVADGPTRLCIASSLRDVAYRNTMLPFTAHMLRKKPVVLLPSSPISDSDLDQFLEEHNLTSAARSEDLIVLNRFKRITHQSMAYNDLIKFNKIRLQINRAFDGYQHMEAKYGAIMKEIAISEAPKVARNCEVLWGQAQALIKKCSAVVASPARPMKSNIMVAAAKVACKPSVEIQSGVLLDNRRYIPPQADRLLIMDEASREVYANLGRTKRVTVVGSIRLDYDLKQFRSVTQSQARECIGAEQDDTLWMLASQPIGVDAMMRICEVAYDAAAKCGATLIVKMHPAETSAYEQAYRELAEKFPAADVRIERRAKSVMVAIAADMVLVYYSTVGVESYALGKPTVIVNPFDYRPGFDLAKMGAAVEVATSDELVRMWNAGAVGLNPPPELTDGLTIKRCEKIVDRLIAHPHYARGRQQVASTTEDVTSPQTHQLSRLQPYLVTLGVPAPIAGVLRPFKHVVPKRQRGKVARWVARIFSRPARPELI